MAFNKEKSEVNIELLTQDLKLIKVSSFVIFKNKHILVLSPTIQADGGLFDVNYNTIVEVKNLIEQAKIKLIIIRYFEKLLIGDLDEFLSKLTDSHYIYSPPGNPRLRKWQYGVKENNSIYKIKGRGENEVALVEMEKREVIEFIEKRLEDIENLDSIKIDRMGPTKRENEGELLSFVNSYILSKGFFYSINNIQNFYLSLRSKPFVIISGVSGTGKTKIVQLFAESIGATEENGRFKLIPVRPDWSDSSDLLGYLTLQEEYKKGPLAEIVEHAMNYPECPHFALLDEMNLARVEYYFSDVLSVMESRKKGENGRITSSPLVDPKLYQKEAFGDSPEGPLYLPNNLYIIGTVNMDETTHPFSKKILDRANTIEFNQILLNHFDFLTERAEEVPPLLISNENLEAKYIHLIDVFNEHQDLIKGISRDLEAINGHLTKINAQVGYRVRDEICFYLVHNAEANLLQVDEALDFCYMQKILPRISGGQAVRSVLEGLKVEWMIQDEDGLKPKYPKSVSKVEEMLERLDEDGFTSFWIA